MKAATAMGVRDSYSGVDSDRYRELANASATSIREVAEQKGVTEATISQEFDAQLKILLASLDFEYRPAKEQILKNISGRTDSRLGNVTIEFKKPSAVKTARQKSAAVEQLGGYLRSFEDDRYQVGYVTDGLSILRVVRFGTTVEEGVWRPLDGEGLVDASRWILALRRVALTAENLIACLLEREKPLLQLAKTLRLDLEAMKVPRTQMLFREWMRLFNLAHDDRSQQSAIDERRTALADLFGIVLDPSDRLEEYRCLFALQTAIAITAKLIAFRVLAAYRPHTTHVRLADISTLGHAELGPWLREVESGRPLRAEGLTNLLEHDFFSWYVFEGQWSPGVSAAVTKVILELADFEQSVLVPAKTHLVSDLFRDLYEAAVPPQVRRSLGEFYTPPWLADHTVERALSASSSEDWGDGWRLLDPCCGSGTFLTVGLQRIFDSSSHGEQLDAADLVHRVVGVDLNPLAVLMARVNYFVSISPFIDFDDDLEIPVYLGDASRTPSRVSVGGVECIEYVIENDLEPLRILVPEAALADATAFSLAMSDIELLTPEGDTDAIVERLTELSPSASLNSEIRAAFRTFAETLVRLEHADWNGIWCRVVANFLATAVLGEFDVVVGNPPWIDWKTLPETYRASLVHTVGQTLFSGDSITGGVNLNVCAVIANASGSRWLSASGALAFLMPDTILNQQTYEGFRRNLLSPGPGALVELFDWSRAGRPFAPVSQKFMTYVIRRTSPDYANGIPLIEVSTAKGFGPTAISHLRRHMRFKEVEHVFHQAKTLAVVVDPSRTYFVRCESSADAARFRAIAGSTKYRGREGIEFYPQDIDAPEAHSRKQSCSQWSQYRSVRELPGWPIKAPRRAGGQAIGNGVPQTTRKRRGNTALPPQ